jgi:hypothetical protein
LRYEIEGVDGVQRFGVMQERDTIQWVGSGEARTVDRPLSVEAAAESLGWLAVEGTFPVILFPLLLRSLVAVNHLWLWLLLLLLALVRLPLVAINAVVHLELEEIDEQQNWVTARLTPLLLERNPVKCMASS